ncbi:hypothetical protein MMC31_000407 [Peltigera leucophlebia]|nr:hypothetical protein [Peltigera leucophlebia]
MDAQILYFSRRLHSTENSSCEWSHIALPISKEHLKSTPAAIPSTTPNMCRDIDMELLEQVAILLDSDDGRMKGWELHAVKGPTLGVAEQNGPIQYRAEVIIVREKPLLLSDEEDEEYEEDEEDESVKGEA